MANYDSGAVLSQRCQVITSLAYDWSEHTILASDWLMLAAVLLAHLSCLLKSVRDKREAEREM